MGRACTVCRHPKHAEINQLLVDGAQSTMVAEEFSLSHDAMHRHRKAHLSRIMATAAEAAVEMLPPETAQARLTRAERVLQLSRGCDLVEHLEGLRADAKAIQRGAERNGDRRTALLAIRELVRIVDIHGRLTGELGNTLNLGIQLNASGKPVIPLELLDQIFDAERERTGEEDVYSHFVSATSDFGPGDFHALWQWISDHREKRTALLLEGDSGSNHVAGNADGQPKPEGTQDSQ